MTDTPKPLLVYDRIDSNRRKTRLLLASFAVTLLPVISGGAVFIVPWNAMHARARQSYVASLQAQGVSLPDWLLLDLPAGVLWLDAGALFVSMAIVALGLVAATAFLISRYGSRVVLHGVRARPVDPDQERDLVQVVENLCIGAGLPLPRIHVIESAAPNAFATGRNPHDASLVMTRGLLRLLDRRELEGVIAHELSHIGNHGPAFEILAPCAVSLPSAAGETSRAAGENGQRGIAPSAIQAARNAGMRFQAAKSGLDEALQERIELLARMDSGIAPAALKAARAAGEKIR